MKWITPPDQKFVERVDNHEANHLLRKGWKLAHPAQRQQPSERKPQ